MRVLLVEDDESMAATLSVGLRAEGYAVDVSHDGEDGLWHALEEDYDLIVLDVMLPGATGSRWSPPCGRPGAACPC
ncbi:MAG: response regulator [Acidimicrobiales bacterium]